MATDAIGKSDSIVALLRDDLRRRRIAQNAKPADGAPVRQAGPADLRAIAGVEGADAHAVDRGIVEFILAREFGAEHRNDAQFEQLVTRVTDSVRNDPAGADLLAGVVTTVTAQR